MKDIEIIEHMTQIIRDEGIAIRGLVRSEIDRIEAMDHKRNGRIEKLEKETLWVRWVVRKPGRAIAIFIVSVGLIFLGFNEINVHRTVEKLLKIELKEK